MDGPTVSITVNGTQVEARPGARLLDVLRDQGLDIPTLCHDDRLTPYGGCRLCVVLRTDGRGGLIPACSTPVQRGMVIETEAPEVIESRRNNLQLLILNHRMECPVCERSGDCRFQELIYLYGTPEQQLPFELVRRPRDESSPIIVRDPEKCILCGRCVRLCDEVQGAGEIGIVDRGLGAHVTTMLGRPLDCEFCGQCVNACPVGALVARPYNPDVPFWLREHETTSCSLCSCGCEIEVERYEGRIERVTARPGSEPNDGTLCVKGWLGWDLLTSPQRLRTPLVRRGDGQLAEATWEEALSAVAEAAAAARRAGRKLDAVATPRLTCEDAILLREMMAGLGAEPVSLGPEAGLRALVEGVEPVLGHPASTAGLDDLREAGFVLVLRGDPGRTHPLVKNELVRRHRQRELPFALAATFTGGLERHARPFLHLAPGTEPALIGFLARELAASGRVDTGIAGFQEWAASVEGCTAGWTAEVTGVPVTTLEALVAAMLDAPKVVLVVVTGRGLPGDEAETARAAASLCAALGEHGRLLVLGEKANLQGCVLAGLGAPHGAVLERARRGETGWLYLVGQDPAGAWPEVQAGRRALEGAGFVVVQDGFLTETARAAHVVLPVAILAERSGTGIGFDRRPRRYHRVVAPPDGVPQDGMVFRELARRMGLTLPDGEEIRAMVEGLFGTAGAPVRLHAVRLPEERPRVKGLLLDPSPQLFHSGSTTTHSAILEELSPGIALRMAPVDAQAAGLGNGDVARLVTGGREVLLRARIDRRVRPGTVMAPWRTWNDGAARLITSEGEVVQVRLRRS